ncbi:MAG: WG repeat-containing protein [Pirellula sp.]
MLKYLPVVVCMAWLGSFLGCTRKPKVVTIDQLSFPVIRILVTREEPVHGDGETTTKSKYVGHALIFADKQGFSRIPVQELWNVTEPVVIDSNATVLDIRDIKNEHGGLWAMINPSGQMPVKFTLLERKETGIEAARDLVANCRFLGRDLGSDFTELRRERIRKATKGEEIIQILCEAPPPTPPKIVIEQPNEKGFARISIRNGNTIQEGIVDADGNEVVQPSPRTIVDDITGSLAVVRFKRKAVFVPLDDGYVSSENLDSIDGYQSAKPFSCGLARVSVDDVYFYIDSNFKKAFDLDFDFAESFHQDRAYVKAGDRHRIIDTQGNTVAELNYDEVKLQSPWCRQVTKIENEKSLSGFVDLNGNRITDLVYDDVGYYEPEVKRIRVSKDGLHGYLDEYAKAVVPVKYERVEGFDLGKVRVVHDGRTFFINPDGVEVPK